MIFGGAADLYQQASQLDPNFDAASANTETAIGMSETFGASSNALASARALEPFTPTGIDPLSERLDILGQNIEAPLISSDDVRKPAVEAILQSPLADPPPPPRGNKK